MKVSVAVAARNEASGISKTLRAILESSFSEFELIVVDDASTDNTLAILEAVEDPRLRIIRNSTQLGPAASLNKAINSARGEYIFITDADCIVAPGWIEEGMKSLSAPDVVGVEGDIYYPVIPDSIRYKVPCNPFYHSFSRRISTPGADFATGNIAYRRRALEKLGGLNVSQYGSAREDTELGWRALKLGRIVHNPKMIVEHKVETWTWRALIRNAARYEKDVLFFKDYGFFFFSWRRVLHPQLLFFPSLLWKYRRMPLRDYRLLPAVVAYSFLARFFIWKGAIRYKTFVF